MKRARGFTHIECLTMSVILLLLLSALLPAVQLAREDARMIQCKNNLKQIGLACHNYHDAHNRFPNGWVSGRITGAGQMAMGWQTRLLPYIDQPAMYNQLNFSVPEDPSNHKIYKTTIRSYLCPVDSIEPLNIMRGGWAPNSYTGNYGSVPIPRWSLSSGADSFWPGQSAAFFQYSEAQEISANGLFQMNQCTGIRDIIDGTSNTLLAGERSAVGGGAIWAGPRSNYHESDILSDGSYASLFNRSDTGFSSRHAGVINFCICDGSVRSVRVDLDSQPGWGVQQKLCARNDNQVIGEF